MRATCLRRFRNRPVVLGQAHPWRRSGQAPVVVHHLSPAQHSCGCSAVSCSCAHQHAHAASYSVSWARCIAAPGYPPVRIHCTSLHAVSTARQYACGSSSLGLPWRPGWPKNGRRFNRHFPPAVPPGCKHTLSKSAPLQSALERNGVRYDDNRSYFTRLCLVGSGATSAPTTQCCSDLDRRALIWAFVGTFASTGRAGHADDRVPVILCASRTNLFAARMEK